MVSSPSSPATSNINLEHHPAARLRPEGVTEGSGKLLCYSDSREREIFHFLPGVRNIGEEHELSFVQNEMPLIERIQKDLTEAMMSKDELRLSVLRMVKSALKYKEVEKVRPLEDAESLQVLQTLVKQRRESVEQFARGGRQDLADKETKEIAILENYLPAAPSDSDLSAAIEAAISETGANSPKAMGAVIKAAKTRLEGKAVDGKVLSDRVRERLSKMG